MSEFDVCVVRAQRRVTILPGDRREEDFVRLPRQMERAIAGPIRARRVISLRARVCSLVGAIPSGFSYYVEWRERLHEGRIKTNQADESVPVLPFSKRSLIHCLKKDILSVIP